MKNITPLLLALLIPASLPSCLRADEAPPATIVTGTIAADQNAAAKAEFYKTKAEAEQWNIQNSRLLAQLNDKRNAENVYTGTTTLTLPDNATPINGATGTLTINVSPKLVKAAYLGVFISPTDRTLQAQLKLTQGTGLVINNIDDKSPAETAGLQPNDIITMFADQIVINPDQFEVLVRSHKPGDSVELTVIRQAQPQKISVTLTEKEQPELAWLLNSHQPNPFNYQLNPTTGTSSGTGTLFLQGPSTSTGTIRVHPPAAPLK